ncbi:hypothetical protein PUNSTDRAFT_135126 [Punctularia strigosozonata HHB-11173 SS5]|uniref:uncharacterized protein n=1 Tax=Punctularia strigosozonata (strain HHB-11173) TaxID=741275 RepID=UPI0004416B88|nr:uncharacterized protein PUNSTDRAFT_135126 [Punctularia strigosozonata HHB-11173 SS5]EIN07602.1 hypothetical protein PUNSTDRAFT_135126 [Punctularia strigosozonata HHB-11173 SS5]
MPADRLRSSLPHSSSPMSSVSLGNHRRDPLPQVQLTANGRLKPEKNTDPWIDRGRHYARFITMFERPAIVLRHAQRRLLDYDEDTVYTAEEDRWYTFFEAICDAQPGFRDLIMEAELQEFEKIEKSMQKGQNNARNQDTNTLKSRIVLWLNKTITESNLNLPPLDGDNKIGRGYIHELTDWSDTFIKQALRNGTATIQETVIADDGTSTTRPVPINGSHFPMFLWKGSYNPDAPWVGFCQGSLLVKVYRCIFISPSAANSKKGDQARTSIAYIATQPTFNKYEKACDSHRFFNALLDWFEDPDFKMFSKDLLQWWNRQIFPATANLHSKSTTNDTVHCMKAALAATNTAVPTSAVGEDDDGEI